MMDAAFTRDECSSPREIDCNLLDAAFSMSLLENIGCSREDVRRELEDRDDRLPHSIDDNDARKIRSFANAFELMEERSSYPLELRDLMDYDETLGRGDVAHRNPGVVRDDVEVRISGCRRIVPPIGIEQAYDVLVGHRDFDDPVDQAAYLAVALPKAQIFYDGNKRTALLACDHVLRHHGTGLALFLRDEVECAGYVDVLLDFYEDAIGLEEAMDTVRELIAPMR